MKIWAKITGLHFRTNHSYPCGKNLKDPNASTIQFPHTHRMYVSLKIQQKHTNRDIEYISLENELRIKLDQISYEMGNDSNFSCEDIAMSIYSDFKRKYTKRDIIVEVLEDNHNGTVLGDC